MEIRGFDPGLTPQTWPDFKSRYSTRICVCSGPYDFLTIDVIRLLCTKCHKPPSYLLFKCLECSYVWVHHGSFKFTHPDFCRIHPRCYDCCGQVRCNCYSHRMLAESAGYCDTAYRPPGVRRRSRSDSQIQAVKTFTLRRDSGE